MGTLKEDIQAQSDWIVKAFVADGFKLDYSIVSVIEVDRFFAANMKMGNLKKVEGFMEKGLAQNSFLLALMSEKQL